MKIKNIELSKNMIMPPIATYKSDENGFVTDENIEYYAARAKNTNIGLIITEHNYITLQGLAKPKQMSIATDEAVPGLKKLVDAIHANGCLAISQMNHCGSAANLESVGLEMVAPSAVVHPLGTVVPREITKDEIKQVVCDFANAARRAKEAGYDGVEIHSAHSYLLNQFYSPLTNKRTDEYGGCLDNRLRIHKEVIEAVRAAVGEDYLIALRLGASDYMDGGSTIEDGVYAAKCFEAWGVDLLDISGGMCRFSRPDHDEPGYFKDSSAPIKAAVSIPVILTGGVHTVAEAQALIAEGACDIVGIGRELMKDANWEMAK